MKFYPLALLALMLAATTATAGEAYNYNNSLADCGCQPHSWKNGCCERQPSCCDHLWDGYGCNRGNCGLHLPVPTINWNCLHAKAPAYQLPCLRLPKLHLPGRCASDCCTAQPACDDACTTCDDACGSAACRHTPVFDWIHCVLHNDSCNCSCGHGHPVKNLGNHLHAKIHGLCHRGCGCDTACCGDAVCCGDVVDGDMTYETAPSMVAPENELPMPPAPTTEPSERKKKDSKKNKKDNKTASLWLLPSLSL